MTTEIPRQLQNENFKFVLLGEPFLWKNSRTGDIVRVQPENYKDYSYDKTPWNPLGKSPFEDAWQMNGYKFNDVKLLNHINHDGKNYGVIGGNGMLRIIDIDDPELAKEIKLRLNTFTVQTGSGGMHFYIICEYGNNHRFVDRKGEFRANNYQVVGPNCIHPNGNKYTIINDSEIKTLTEEEIMLIINPLITKKVTSLDVDVISENQISVPKEFIELNILPKLSNLAHSLITQLKTREELKSLGFDSRSERDQKVITTLVLNGFGRYVKSVFDIYPIGDKYKEHSNGDVYLEHSIKGARKYSGVVDDNIPRLEIEIENIPINVLRNKIDAYLIEIGKIKNWVSRTYLINVIARKVMISSKDLQKRMEELIHSMEDVAPQDMMDLMDEKLPEIGYWVYPLIPKNFIICFGGKPSSFKSMLVLTLLVAMKTKFPFIKDFKLSEENPKILLLDIENGKYLLNSRMKYIVNNKDLDVKKLKGFDVKYDFSKTDLQKEFNIAKEYDIIVLDSYRRFLEGSENDSEISNKFYLEFLKPLKDLGKTVILIHHLKKIDLNEVTDESLMDAFRGTGDFIAQLDLVHGVFRNKEVSNAEGTKLIFDVNLHLAKNRMGLIIPPVSFKVEKDDVSKTASFRESTFQRIAPPKTRAKNLIVGMIQTAVEIGAVHIVKKVQETTSLSDMAIYKYLKELVDEGVIIKSESGKYKIALNVEEDTGQEDNSDENV